ncbi:hypothetical protein NECAME_05416 [Necator americanus]|uniref:FERM protein n=1 Tax=Necator americanus TaxID=51031 RepID=W2SH80_NECAM|nr:hypothetical protein NECAME_05416 [Necator americanus]ETN68960.1 hypothetical protein NECAME_05416 [Necator americanus]
MHEGRSATVRLLDGECLEISVIARLSVNDVLTLAAHHCRLQQSDARYFGLAFVDNKFFVDSIVSLENPAVIEAFFLEAHQQFVKGQLDLSNIDYVRVGGLLLQIYRGDWSDDPSVLNDMDSLVPYHSRLLRQYGLNKTSFEKQVLMEYARLRGIQRGSAIVS